MELKTIEDFRDNRITNKMLSADEFTILCSVPPESLVWWSNTGWDRQTYSMKPCKDESLVYRYSPQVQQ